MKYKIQLTDQQYTKYKVQNVKNMYQIPITHQYTHFVQPRECGYHTTRAWTFIVKITPPDNTPDNTFTCQYRSIINHDYYENSNRNSVTCRALAPVRLFKMFTQDHLRVMRFSAIIRVCTELLVQIRCVVGRIYVHKKRTRTFACDRFAGCYAL